MYDFHLTVKSLFDHGFQVTDELIKDIIINPFDLEIKQKTTEDIQKNKIVYLIQIEDF